MKKTLEIQVNRNSLVYPVEIGDEILGGLHNRLRSLCSKTSGRPPKVFLLTHQHLYDLYGARLQVNLEAMGFEVALSLVTTGEQVKTWRTAEELLRVMLSANLDRSSYLLALGGGVIGDLGGFIAAIFYRGIGFVQIPTTLLSAVDASVGGKVAVNLGEEGKNLVGAFHQPNLVAVDVNTFSTLDAEEWKNGLSEVVKYAFLSEDNGEFYDWLLTNRDEVLFRKSKESILEMVEKSISCKGWVVSQDETERSGKRKLLNLGHTFAHALEAESHYRMPHGKAVSIGIALAATLSRKMGLCNGELADKVNILLEAFTLPRYIDKELDYSPEALISHFRYDKKVERGMLRFILPVGKNIGYCREVENPPEELLHETLMELTR